MHNSQKCIRRLTTFASLICHFPEGLNQSWTASIINTPAMDIALPTAKHSHFYSGNGSFKTLLGNAVHLPK